MRLIGITGQTGAGKSTVCAALAARGYPVIDGDILARQATRPGSPLLAELAAEFGEDILINAECKMQNAESFNLENAELDRKLLAQRAFASPEATKKLNAIIHPAIAEMARERLTELNAPIVFLEGAALHESPLADDCAMFVAVTAPEDIRLERIIARDKLSTEEARLRMSAQNDEEFYCDIADFVIANDGKHNLEEQLETLQKILALLEEKPRRKKIEGVISWIFAIFYISLIPMVIMGIIAAFKLDTLSEDSVPPILQAIAIFFLLILTFTLIALPVQIVIILLNLRDAYKACRLGKKSAVKIIRDIWRKQRRKK